MTERAPWHLTGLRAFVYALCAAAFAFPLVDGLTVMGTAAGAALGAVLGVFLAPSKLRSAVVPAGGAVLGFVVFSLLSIVGGSPSLAESVGPAALLGMLDTARWLW